MEPGTSEKGGFVAGGRSGSKGQIAVELSVIVAGHCSANSLSLS